MDLFQIGTLLQIIGFVITTVFVGILLDKGTFNILQGKGELFLISMISILDRVTFNWGKTHNGFAITIPGDSKLSTIGIKRYGIMLIYSILASLPATIIGLIISRYIYHSPVLLWIGISLIIIVVLIIIITIIKNILSGIDAEKNTDEHQIPLKKTQTDEIKKSNPAKTNHRYLSILAIIILLPISILLFSALLVPMCLILGIFRIVQITIVLLKERNTLKKCLIVIGAIIIIVGLIIQFLSTI